MNRVLVISYDLVNPGQNYERLLALIKSSYSSWARLGGSAYLIFTDVSVVDVRDHLAEALDTNDKLFVGVAPPPSAWRGLPDEVSKWIHANQK